MRPTNSPRTLSSRGLPFSFPDRHSAWRWISPPWSWISPQGVPSGCPGGGEGREEVAALLQLPEEVRHCRQRVREQAGGGRQDACGTAGRAGGTQGDASVLDEGGAPMGSGGGREGEGRRATAARLACSRCERRRPAGIFLPTMHGGPPARYLPRRNEAQIGRTYKSNVSFYKCKGTDLDKRIKSYYNDVKSDTRRCKLLNT